MSLDQTLLQSLLLRNVKVQNVLLLHFYYSGPLLLYRPLFIYNFVNVKYFLFHCIRDTLIIKKHTHACLTLFRVCTVLKQCRKYIWVFRIIWSKLNKKNRCENFRIFGKPTSNYVFGLLVNDDLGAVIDFPPVSCAEDVRARNHFFPRFHLITAAVDAQQLGHNC